MSNIPSEHIILIPIENTKGVKVNIVIYFVVICTKRPRQSMLISLWKKSTLLHFTNGDGVTITGTTLHPLYPVGPSQWITTIF